MGILIALMRKPLVLLRMGQRNLSDLHQLHRLRAGGHDPLGCLSERRTGHKVNVLYPGQEAWRGSITEDICQTKLKKDQSLAEVLEAGTT